MNPDPTLRALADINPVRPDEVAGQHDAEWALTERDRILAMERTTGADGGTARRTVSRRVTGSLITAGALAGIAALSVAVWVGGKDDAPPAPTGGAVGIGVLERPRAAGDALPAWTRGQDALRTAGARPATSRRAGDLGDRGLFVVRTESGGVCLVDAVDAPTAGTPNPGGINCQPRAALERTFLVSKLDGGSGPRGLTAVGVVPDGFTRVTSGTRATDAQNNVFVMRGVDASQPVIAEGPAGRRVETLGVIPTYAPAPDARTRLPVAALAPDARAGSRSQRIGNVLYSVQPRSGGDIAIYRRRIAADGSLTSAGMLSVGWPQKSNPVWTSTTVRTRPDRTSVADVTGIAPDGYDRVTVARRSAPIRDNLIVVKDVRFTAADGVVEAVATGPAGTLRVPVIAMPAQPRTPLRPSAAP